MARPRVHRLDPWHAGAPRRAARPPPPSQHPANIWSGPPALPLPKGARLCRVHRPSRSRCRLGPRLFRRGAGEHLRHVILQCSGLLRWDGPAPTPRLLPGASGTLKAMSCLCFALAYPDLAWEHAFEGGAPRWRACCARPSFAPKVGRSPPPGWPIPPPWPQRPRSVVAPPTVGHVLFPLKLTPPPLGRRPKRPVGGAPCASPCF